MRLAMPPLMGERYSYGVLSAYRKRTKSGREVIAWQDDAMMTTVCSWPLRRWKGFIRKPRLWMRIFWTLLICWKTCMLSENRIRNQSLATVKARARQRIQLCTEIPVIPRWMSWKTAIRADREGPAQICIPADNGDNIHRSFLFF